jgi:hypothetical protein
MVNTTLLSSIKLTALGDVDLEVNGAKVLYPRVRPEIKNLNLR